MMIEVDDIEINVTKRGTEDYFSLTNMVQAKLRNLRVADWLRTKRALGTLFAWEYVNNKNFNYGEFAAIMDWMKKPGSGYFKLGVKDWIERTEAIGLIASSGRYGGTYSHKDIAVEFAGWVSPLFRQALIDVLRSPADEELKASK